MEWLALLLMVLSVGTLLVGVFIEHGQRSETGPVAMVPTLPHAFGAGLLAAMGTAALRVANNPWVAWWYSPLAFLLVLVLGVRLIVAVGARAERNRRP